MWHGRWALVVVVLLSFWLQAGTAFADENLTPDQMIARADAIVQKAQALQDKALEALKAARASGDVSAIQDANTVLTTVKMALNKAEKDRNALKAALAKGDIEEARSIFEGLLVAEETFNGIDSALATIGGPGIESSVDGTEALDVGSDDGQPSLDTDDPLSRYSGDYDDRIDDSNTYDSDTGSSTGGKPGDGVTNPADDLITGSPTGSALE